MHQKVTADLLYELLVWLLRIQQNDIRMRRDEPSAEFRMIFLRELWHLVRILFHASSPGGELPLKSMARVPYGGELHQGELLLRIRRAQSCDRDHGFQSGFHSTCRVAEHSEHFY